MKKLLILVVIIVLPIIAYFEYVSWKRFSPPTEYLYEIQDDIDVSYYNHDLVKEYYENALEIGRYARQKYFNSDIDVLYPEEGNIESMNASKYYFNLVARTKFLEALFRKSAELKKAGFSNEDIKLMESTGMSKMQLDKKKTRENYLGLKFGDKSSYVWHLQKILTKKGYEVPIDGLFGTETEGGLKEFQKANNLYPSGEADNETFDLLFEI